MSPGAGDGWDDRGICDSRGGTGTRQTSSEGRWEGGRARRQRGEEPLTQILLEEPREHRVPVRDKIRLPLLRLLGVEGEGVRMSHPLPRSQSRFSSQSPVLPDLPGPRSLSRESSGTY